MMSARWVTTSPSSTSAADGPHAPSAQASFIPVPYSTTTRSNAGAQIFPAYWAKATQIPSATTPAKWAMLYHRSTSARRLPLRVSHWATSTPACSLSIARSAVLVAAAKVSSGMGTSSTSVLLLRRWDRHCPHMQSNRCTLPLLLPPQRPPRRPPRRPQPLPPQLPCLPPH